MGFDIFNEDMIIASEVARGIAVVVVLGLGLVVAMLPGEARPPAATIVTTTAPGGAATLGAPDATRSELGSPPTSVSAAANDDEARRVEVEKAAHAAYVGWFDGIFRDDPAAVEAAVATAEMRAAGMRAMTEDRIEFTAAPSPENVSLVVDEVLLDRSDCVVAVVTDDLSAFVDAARTSRTVITVYWPGSDTGRLVIATQWEPGTPESVWRTDCDRRARGWER